MTHLRPLTGLRFMAALWVVVFHGTFSWHPGLVSGSVFAAIAMRGDLAVPMFFVLSGFILGYTYLTVDGTFRGSWRSYFVKRLARLYPVYFLGIALAVVPYFAWGSDRPPGVCATPASGVATLVATVMLAQTWLPGNAGCLNPPGWSLSVEASFYLVFPLISMVIGRLPRPYLVPVAGVAWLVSVALACYHAGPALPGSGSLLIHHAATFLIGLVGGRLFVMRGPASAQRRWPLVGFTALAGIAVLITRGAQAVAFADVYLVPLYALLIYALANSRGLLATFCARPVFVALGEASYALYILHWPMLEWLAHLMGDPWGLPATADPLAWPLFATYVCLMIALSLLTYRYVEMPARRYMRRLC